MARPLDLDISTKLKPTSTKIVPGVAGATPLSATKKLVRDLVVQPLAVNSHSVWVGDSTVNHVSDTGIRLSGDASMAMNAVDLSQVYVAVSDTTDGVNINYFA